MNFDYIEGLTEEKIKELYDYVIETDYISEWSLWELRCQNGYTSFWNNYDRDHRPIGWGYYELNGAGSNAVCGRGQWGYTTVVAKYETILDTTGKKLANVWELRCQNGYTGLFLNYSTDYRPIGWGYYELNGYGSNAVCGRGQWGYTTLVGRFFARR